MHRLNLGLLIGLLLSLALLAFPGNKAFTAQAEDELTARLIEGARKEGKLVWYASIGLEDGNELLKRFHEKYPFIATQIYRTGGEGMFTKIMAEARAERHLWDVLCSTPVESLIIQKKGLSAKYLSPQRKFYSEGFKDQEGYWTDLYVNLNVVGYNTRLVSTRDAPKAWNDLLDPRWKGKMGMDTRPFYWFAGMLKIMGEKKGLEYMEKLSQQNITFRTGRVVTTQLMAAGELSIGITQHNQRVEEMKARGAPIEWIAIEPVIAEIHPLSLSARAAHPNAAKLFVDYLLSREGQSILAKFYRVPSRNDVDPVVPRLTTKGLNILPFDPSIAEDYERYVNLYRRIFLKPSEKPRSS